ncbi:MAG: hypothetical protein U0638_13365 [Phycisphaerales bacterium]
MSRKDRETPPLPTWLVVTGAILLIAYVIYRFVILEWLTRRS